MYPIEINYELTLRDYRMALYFGKMQQQLLNFRILAGSFVVTFLYYIISLFAGLPFPLALWLLPGAYFIWALFTLANLELGIRKYLNDPDCVLGLPFRAIFTDYAVEVRMPSKKSVSHCVYEKLAMIVEITGLYMVYLDGAQTFLISKKQLTPEQQALLRASFKKRLGDRFFTTFNKRRPADGGFGMFQKKK